MSTALDALGISEEEYIESEGVAKEIDFIWESGVYDLTLGKVFSYTTKSGAKMLIVDVINTLDGVERKNQFGFNTQYKDKSSGDMVENKAGTAAFKGLCYSTGLKPSEIQTANEEVEAYGSKYQGLVFKNMANRKIKAAVRELLDESSQYPRGNEIEIFANAEGINAKGEGFDKFLAKIEKAPIKIKKGKAKTAISPSVSTEAAKTALANL